MRDIIPQAEAADAKRQQELAEEQRRKKQQDMAGAQEFPQWQF